MDSSTATPLPSSTEELESLIRRVVREEFDALLEHSRIGMELEDEALAADAIAILEADRDRPEAWISWEEAKAEIARVEAAGELPD
ncbi:MAG: hypothetical protein GY856_41845 [bacterium]|nr:hypothetical protein [bacterium]